MPLNQVSFNVSIKCSLAAIAACCCHCLLLHQGVANAALDSDITALSLATHAPAIVEMFRVIHQVP